MQTRDTQALHLTTQGHRHVLSVLLYLALSAIPQLVIASTQSMAVTEQLPVRGEREFKVALNKGDVLELEVVKGDLNLSVGVYDPGSRLVIEYLSHSYEPVELSAVVEDSGEYVIKIRSLETVSRQDQIAVTAQPARPATGQDVKNAVARLAIATASHFSSEWNEKSLRKAIDDYIKASSIAADPRIAAAALRKAGETQFILGEYQKALDHFEKAAALSERSGAKEDALYATAQAARLQSLLGNNEKARRDLNRVIGFYSSRAQNATPALKQAYACALNYQGEISYSMGDLVGASAALKQALKLLSETVDRNGRATALFTSGHVANLLGQLDQAMDHFNEAYELYREVGNKLGEGLSLTGKGITHTYERKDEEGIKLHREAIAIFQKLGSRPNEAITLNGIGSAFQNLNENALALDHYKRAQALLQESGAIDFLPSSIYQMASLYKAMNDLESALKYFEDCARLSHATKKHRMAAYALDEIASIYAVQGRRKQALDQYFKVLRFHSPGDLRGRAVTLNNLGDLYLSLGRKREALAVYKQALPLSEKSAERGIEMRSIYNLMRAARDSGAFDEAKAYAEHSIEVIERSRSNVVSPDLRLSYFSGLRKFYDLYIDILWLLDKQRPGEGFAEQALLASERSRARAFLDLLAETGAGIRQGVDPSLLKREKELQSLLAAHARYQIDAATSTGSKQEQADVAQFLDALKAEYEELQAQVRNQSPRYQNLVRPKPLTIAEIQAQLSSEDLLLEYVLGEERSYLWAVTRTSVNLYELKPKAVLDAAGLEFYKLLTVRQDAATGIDSKYQTRVNDADTQYPEKALALSRLLLGPVAGMLAKKRLILVTEGILQYLAFDALPDPAFAGNLISPDDLVNSLLIADHEIVSLPSVSALAVIRAESNRGALPRRTAAVFADPVFSKNDDRVSGAGNPALAAASQRSDQPVLRGPGISERSGLRRLTYSSDEADSIYEAASGDAWVLKGFEASRENAMADQLRQYLIIHFATHGFVNTERPELSAIVMTMVKSDGSPADGFLQLHDILNLELSAELTVLSACETGLGKDVRGEGLISLTRGLMFAGSRTVVASLWKVDDRATAALMGHFYKALLQDGMTRSAALRYAKQELRKNPAWSSPFFWAGFVLQGEYDKPITVEHKSRVPRGVAVLLVIPVVGVSLLILRNIYRAKRLKTAGVKVE